MNAHVASYRVLSLAERTVLPRLVFFGLGRLPSGRGEGGPGGRCVAGLGTVRAHARSLRRPGTLSYALGPWSPGTGILVSDNFQSCRVERKEPHDLEAPSWARTGSTHHPCGGGGSQVAHVVPASRMRGEFRCVEGVGCSCSDGRHAPATFGRHAPSRVRAAAAVAAANSGPIVTHGLQSGVKSGEEMHRSTSSQAQKIGRWTAPPVFSHILPFNGLCLYGSCRPHLRP